MENKTYMETQRGSKNFYLYNNLVYNDIDKPEFNWFEAINQMKVIKARLDSLENPSEEYFKLEGEYSGRYGELKSLAENWVTCACGNQCYIIPRTSMGQPIDNHLSNLGVSFSFKIDAEEWDWALELLKEIEQRSAELIIEINK